MIARPAIPHPCYRTGCTEKPTRYFPGDPFAKCETHYADDLAHPWGSVERVFTEPEKKPASNVIPMRGRR